MTRWTSPLACAMLAAGTMLPAGTALAQGTGSTLPEGPGANLVYANCRTCHSLQYVVEGKGLLPAQWRAVLQGMEDYGMEISKAQHDQILDYLVTYLGPHPPPQAAARSPGQASASVDGATVYAQNCATCHGAEGGGVPGYYPPLAGNPDLAMAREFPALVVLHGLEGPIEVKERRYDGSMPSFAHLSDAKIAAVVNHVRDAWSNAASGIEPITPDAVARLRERDIGPAQVHAAREKMR